MMNNKINQIYYRINQKIMIELINIQINKINKLMNSNNN